MRPRPTIQPRRTNGSTPDRDSALSKWQIARAIEVNQAVRRSKYTENHFLTQCPLCYAPFRLVTESGIEIDVCDICNGVWLDAGELDSLADSRKFVPHSFSADELTDFRCPRCKIRDFARIETDLGNFAFCTQCKGMFVGGDTLDQIAKTERSLLPSKAVAETVIATPDLILSMFDLLWLFGNH